MTQHEIKWAKWVLFFFSFLVVVLALYLPFSHNMAMQNFIANREYNSQANWLPVSLHKARTVLTSTSTRFISQLSVGVYLDLVYSERTLLELGIDFLVAKIVDSISNTFKHGALSVFVCVVAVLKTDASICDGYKSLLWALSCILFYLYFDLVSLKQADRQTDR